MRAILLTLALAAITSAALAAPAEVRERKDGAGVIYADAQDRTLYTYAQDKPGKSLCNDVCARAWPPLIAPGDAKSDAAWSAIARDDGKKQWALNGRPVYIFAKDLPGTSFGEGAGNLAWRVAMTPIFTPPGVTQRQSVLGRILIDRGGHTLYRRTDGKPCTAKCLEDWMPLIAPLAAKAKGDWTMVARDDGARQWAYRGQVLYTYTRDSRPGEIEGHGRDKAWQAAVLSPAAGEPAWVTIQGTDMGEVFADATGRTLYVAPAGLDQARKLMCDQACLDAAFTAVAATDTDKNLGDWSVVTRDGKKLWAYKGDAVFTHSRDRKPGEVGGDRWLVGTGLTSAGGGYQPVMRPTAETLP